MNRALKLILVGLMTLQAQVGRSDFSSDLNDAAKPLAGNVPEVAVVRLRNLLQKNLSESEWRATAEKLTESLLAAGQAADALTLLDDPRSAGISTAKFWRAQALADLKRPGEALPFYQEVASDNSSPFQTAAIFGAGETLRALKKSDDALEQFNRLSRDARWGIRARLRSAELLIDKGNLASARRILEEIRPPTLSDRQERQLLRGRLSVTEHPERGISTFESVLKNPEGASHPVLIATLFALAEAHLHQGTPETGDDVLENFIDHHPQDVDLAQVFGKLDELYRAERKPSTTELERWVRDVEQPRRALAQWFLARMELREGHRDRALQLLTAFRQSKIKSPTLAGAYVDLAELEMSAGHSQNAMSILQEARLLRPEQATLDRINVLLAGAQYREKHFDVAATEFEKVANSSSLFAQSSKFNAALAWLEAGDDSRFSAAAADVEKQSGAADANAELRLEEALAHAGRQQKDAADLLRSFLRDFPRDKRASEAWVALAELAFHATPPRLDEARSDLVRTSELTPTPAASERADYLSIWIEDSVKGNDAKVIELAKQFLDRHGQSAKESEVRLKLAEAYYRREDFPNAQTEFETLAEESPSGPLSEKALFFAAESAMSSMASNSLDRAIILFDRVVRMNGELKWAARNEQAAIERKLGKPQDALALYQEVLRSGASQDEKREALCGTGDILLELGGTDGANYGKAIEAYDQLVATAGDQIQWRNQALFKKGICLEKQSDKRNALTTFYKIIEDETRPNRPHELFWFYKAGFNAARLLEEDSKWKSAAAIYEKLAAVNGVRSQEAKARLDKLRLEHFLWPE